ncbi:MAG: rRNA maturation RNase YbeY [Acidobacteriota bacterium]|nr:rRNA maturation RNase YbeY [Acidobacteriota bacterium]
MTPRCEIAVQDAARTEPRLLAELARWLPALLAELAPGAASFGVRLAGSDEVRAINEGRRGREGATDVLSFPGGATPEGHHLGDVLIAMPVARAQARELGHGLERELKELLLHGVLHCLGHDHEQDGGEMASLELDLRDRWIGDD